MNGQRELIAMRRRGVRPAGGVRIDAGLFDMLAPMRWSRERWPVAVIRVAPSEKPCELDMRFVHAMPVVLIAECGLSQAWFDALVQRVWSEHPSSLSVLLLQPQFHEDGSSWHPYDAFGVVPGALVDLDPETTYARAFS